MVFLPFVEGGDLKKMSDLTGTVLDKKYELIRMLGEGGMGTVYEAKHLLIGRRLAVKFLHAQYVTSQEVVTRFQREAQAAAAIGHENIIEVTDMGTTSDGAPYIVMEYLDGQDVREALTDKGIIPTGRACHIMVQALSALQAAHDAGIIHRDLKPENIYLIHKPGRPDYVKLLDFGISKFRSLEGEGAKGLTQTGTVLGTPYYMSPEQARGDQDISSRSDIYAMGVILYQMLTGQLPFDAPNYNALLIKILTEEPPPPGDINPDIPDDLVQAIQTAMARDPGDRYFDAMEFRQHLLSHLPSSSGQLDTEMTSASRSAVKAAMSSTMTPLEMTRSGSGLSGSASKNKLPVIIGSVAAAAVAVIVAIVAITMSTEADTAASVASVASPNTAGLLQSPAPDTQPDEDAAAAEEKTGTDESDAKAQSPSPEKAAQVRVNIAASPQKAVIKIDGVPVEGNPFSGVFKKDAVLHKLVIKAEGYDDEKSLISFAKDQDLEYELKKTEPQAQSKRKPRRDKTNRRDKEINKSKKDAKSDKTPKDQGKRKPRRKIDDEDPWS